MGNYVFAGGNGIFRSADSGKTWTPMNFGLAYEGVNDLKSINGALMAGTTEGYVFISRDSASFWDPLGTQVSPKYNTLTLAISDSFLYAGGSISGVAGNFVLTPEKGAFGSGYYIVSLYSSSTHESRMVLIP